mgnify:CR=1 FL=1
MHTVGTYPSAIVKYQPAYSHHPMPTILMLLTKTFSGDVRVSREADTLRETGFDVEIIAWNRESGRRETYETPNKIRVHLIGPRCKTRHFLSFIVGLPRFYCNALKDAIRKKFSIVHSHDFDTLVLGFFLARMRCAKLVYDAHESYADMVAQDAPRFLLAIIRTIEKRLIRRADMVIAANDNVGRLIGAKEFITLMSCPSRSELPLQNRDASSCKKSNLLRLAYFGTLEPRRCILEGANAVSKSSKWCMVIGGSGTLETDVKELSSRSKNVIFLGRVPHDVALRETAASDAVHAVSDPTNLDYRISTPLRMLEAMALSLPSIVTRDTYAAEIVQAEDCGYLAYPTEESISNVLDSLAKTSSDMIKKGANGRAAFEREYNWERQSMKLIRAYQELLSR